MELRNDSAAYEEGVVIGQTIPCAVFFPTTMKTQYRSGTSTSADQQLTPSLPPNPNAKMTMPVYHTE